MKNERKPKQSHRVIHKTKMYKKKVKILQLTIAISLVIGSPPVNFARTVAIIKLCIEVKSMTELHSIPEPTQPLLFGNNRILFTHLVHLSIEPLSLCVYLGCNLKHKIYRPM